MALQTCILKGDESFAEDHNGIHLNKIFNAPTGAKAETGGDQAGEFIKRGRRPPLYAAQEAVENPTVTIWVPPNQNAPQTPRQEKGEASGALIFAQSFIMKQKRLQAIDSAAVGRANARVAVNAFERS
ncbi:MAG: hypothetical protein LBK73_01045, partial [Treponema sp.]|nr:hypothetical protein [Treponema sp.]